jgi:hypothetical protein
VEPKLARTGEIMTPSLHRSNHMMNRIHSPLTDRAVRAGVGTMDRFFSKNISLDGFVTLHADVFKAGKLFIRIC